jgi:hypothetical protein
MSSFHVRIAFMAEVVTRLQDIRQQSESPGFLLGLLLQRLDVPGVSRAGVVTLAGASTSESSDAAGRRLLNQAACSSRGLASALESSAGRRGVEEAVDDLQGADGRFVPVLPLALQRRGPAGHRSLRPEGGERERERG